MSTAAEPGTAANPHENTPFERIGGTPAVRAVVETLYDWLLRDLTVADYFEQVDTPIHHIRRHMVHFVVAALQGPDNYTGRSLAEAHESLRITGQAFDRVANYFTAALYFHQVPEDLIVPLVDTVRSLKPQVVNEG